MLGLLKSSIVCIQSRNYVVNVNEKDIFQSVETLFPYGAVNVILTEEGWLHSVKILYSQCEKRGHISVSGYLITTWSGQR